MKLRIHFAQTPQDRKLYSNHLPMIIGLLLFAMIAVFVGFNERTPAPLGLQAPVDLFSARRAYATLHSIYLHNDPHPTGSLAQQRIGDRIMDYFRKLGYTPELQEVLAADRSTSTCAIVRNIILRYQGVHDGPGILVSAHYDSVPCGEGGMDDGSGTATILELARILRRAPRPQRTIVFLLTDGEEIGLLGAKAFIEHSSEENKISTVIGIDSGGDGGRSRVTQITGDEALLTKVLSRPANAPSGSSAIGSLLDLFHLTEGTSDFEEFKKTGKTGINLVNSTWNFRRHTPEDQIEAINLGTLQDHGVRALSLIRRLSGVKQVYSKQGKMVFFDLLGMIFIHYAPLWAWILQGASYILNGLVWKRCGFNKPLNVISLLAKWLAVIAAGTVGGGLAGYIVVNLPQMPFLLRPALI
ncbi:MAG TPA: M20/M25/M40 family metallo-hydrolase, partial [Bacillota bacterium]|nr:M20/M25/M40 family metallo-hydrolase [Bacillota bacterium]